MTKANIEKIRACLRIVANPLAEAILALISDYEALLKVLEKAPHGSECNIWWRPKSSVACTCWKRDLEG